MAEDVTPLVRAQIAAEQELRDLGREGKGSPGGRSEPWTWPRLIDALGEDALVEFVESRGSLHALTVVDGRVRRHEVGSAASVAEIARWFPFGLRRLATATEWTPATDAAASNSIRPSSTGCATGLAGASSSATSPRCAATSSTSKNKPATTRVLCAR